MDASLENTEICHMRQAEDFLSQYNNCGLNVENFLDELFLQQESWSDFTDIENDIKQKLHQIYSNSNLDCKTLNIETSFKISFECIIFNRLHSFIMPLIYQKLEQGDDFFLNKSTEFCNANVTAEQMGAPENYAVPLLAAVVELSSIDNHKSPLEKLYCLCTTYDLIFAELKTVLIDIISRFSVADSEIPVINNSDIIPILMTVIIRSKLIHLSSNFYYIEAFLGNLNEKNNIRHVLNSFKEAVGRLKVVTKESLIPGCEKVCRDLDLIKLIKITSEVNTKLQHCEEVITPLDGQMLRITDLIVTSTNENHPVL